MVNAALITGRTSVGRKTSCTTCIRTRYLLPRNKGVDMNKLTSGEGWTLPSLCKLTLESV